LRRGVLLSALFLLLTSWLACGGGSSSDTGNLRFVQGSPDAPPVNLLIDGHTQMSNMLYGNASDYISLKTGSRHVQVVPVNSTKPLLDETVSVGSSVYQTLLLTGPVAQLKPVLLTDTVATTTTTPIKNVRVISISTQMGPADVFIVDPSVNLASATPVATNLSLGQDTGYQSITPATGGNPGDFEVFITAPGTRNAYLATGPLAVVTSKNQTIVIQDAAAGGFTFTALQDQ
jgi:hypothetical protein